MSEIDSFVFKFKNLLHSEKRCKINHQICGWLCPTLCTIIDIPRTVLLGKEDVNEELQLETLMK